MTLHEIRKGRLPEQITEGPPELTALVRQMTSVAPGSRPSALEMQTSLRRMALPLTEAGGVPTNEAPLRAPRRRSSSSSTSTATPRPNPTVKSEPTSRREINFAAALREEFLPAATALGAWRTVTSAFVPRICAVDAPEPEIRRLRAVVEEQRRTIEGLRASLEASQQQKAAAPTTYHV